MLGPLAMLESFPSGMGYRVEVTALPCVRTWHVFRGDDKRPCFLLRESRT